MRIFLWILTLGFFMNLSAQEKLQLIVDGEGLGYVDSRDTVAFSGKILKTYWNQGYLFASIDSITSQAVFVYRGSKLDLQGHRTLGRFVRDATEDFERMTNSGYPFARLSWDSLSIEQDKFSALHRIEKGPFVVIDSIILIGTDKLRSAYLQSAANMRLGEPFSEKNFRAIGGRLRSIEFIEMIGNPDVSFQEGKAWIHLNLREKQANEFQGIVGLLPNQSQNGRSLITGNLDLSLRNLFRSGKQFEIHWNRFGEQSQYLELAYLHTYLLKSDLHFGGEIKLTRQDSSFINTEFSGTTEWNLKSGNSIGINYSVNETNVLLESEEMIQASNVLDQEQRWYGITLKKLPGDDGAYGNFINYQINADVGSRLVKRNVNLPNTYYDSIDFEQTNWRFIGHVNGQSTVGKQSAFYGKLSLGQISNSQVPVNQMFRIGGLRTLRGFNEQFFFVQTYAVGQLEYRFYFEDRSMLFLFLDQGLLRENHWDQPTGFGFGLNVETTGGLFSFAAALGRSKNSPLVASNAKIHFGFISQF